jgi:hypothetical protein
MRAVILIIFALICGCSVAVSQENDSAINIPYTNPPLVIPGAIDLWEFDVGGEVNNGGSVYHDSDTVNTGNSTVRPDSPGVDLSNETGLDGKQYICIVDPQPGEYLIYSINVSVPGNYYVTVTFSSPSVGIIIPDLQLGPGTIIPYSGFYADVTPAAPFPVEGARVSLNTSNINYFQLDQGYVANTCLAVITFTLAAEYPAVQGAPQPIPGFIDVLNYKVINNTTPDCYEVNPAYESTEIIPPLFNNGPDFYQTFTARPNTVAIGSIDSGEWVAFDINVTSSSPYLVVATVSDYINDTLDNYVVLTVGTATINITTQFYDLDSRNYTQFTGIIDLTPYSGLQVLNVSFPIANRGINLANLEFTAIPVTPSSSASVSGSGTNTISGTLSGTTSNTISGTISGTAGATGTGTISGTVSHTVGASPSGTGASTVSASVAASVLPSVNGSGAAPTVLASPSPAPACGNGVVEAGEECDAGQAANHRGSCCNRDCRFRHGGDICGPRSGPCFKRRRCNAHGVCRQSVAQDVGARCVSGGVAGTCDASQNCVSSS